MTMRRQKRYTAFLLGLSSGLPVVFLTGTLSAWIAERGVSMATIGILSWITLAYSFKLLWSPLVTRHFRRWIVVCQLGMAGAFGILGAIDPLHSLGRFAAIAFLASLFSATQDIAIDGWRIVAADQDIPVELITTTYQIGSRVATIIAGAAALSIAGYWGWQWVPQLLALVLVGIAALMLFATNVEAPVVSGPSQSATDGLAQRAVSVTLVLVGQVSAIVILGHFMATTLRNGAQVDADINAFIMSGGLIILLAIGLLPILASLLDLRSTKNSSEQPGADQSVRATRLKVLVDHAYRALVAPFGDLVGRFGLRLPVIMLFAATYTLSWLSWAGFTLPLYLTKLGYSKNEVAIAARLVGSGITMLGLLAGGLALLRLRRVHALLLGVLLPILSNFAYADLSSGAHYLGGFSAEAGLSGLTTYLAGNPHLAPLYCALTIKNFASGCASGIFVGHLSTLVSREFAAVQCAIFSSLSFATGTLGAAVAGDLIDHWGFAAMTQDASLIAILAALVVLLDALVARPRRLLT